jgi:hypothetical protein
LEDIYKSISTQRRKNKVRERGNGSTAEENKLERFENNNADYLLARSLIKA